MLHQAAKNPNPELVRVLLRRKVDVNARTEWGDTPLHNAARNDNPEVAIRLLEAGADTRVVNNEGKTPHAVAVRACRDILWNAMMSKLPSASEP